MAVYGRNNTSSTNTSLSTLGEEKIRVNVFAPITEHGWAYRIGFRGKELNINQTSARVRMALYNIDDPASPGPNSLRAYTDRVNPAESISSLTSNIIFTDDTNSRLQTAVQLVAGNRYGLGILATSGRIEHVHINPSQAPSSDTNFYDRGGVTLPPDPLAPTLITNSGVMTIWLDYQENRKPVAAAVSPNGGIADYTPDFVGSFTDSDEVYGDYFSAYAIEVRQVGTATALWVSPVYTTSATNQLQKSFTQTYAGPGLSNTLTYEWRARVYDSFGTASDYTPWVTFAIGTGNVEHTVPSFPTGKITTTTPEYKGIWRHTESRPMAFVDIFIYRNNILINSARVTKVAAINTTFSLLHASSFGADNPLVEGVTYEFALRGIDNLGVQTSISPRATFSVNAVPTTPTNMTPHNGQKLTTPPRLSFTMSDLDNTSVTTPPLTGWIKLLSSPVISNTTFSASETTTGWATTAITPPPTGTNTVMAYASTVSNDAGSGSLVTTTTNNTTASAEFGFRRAFMIEVVEGDIYELTAYVRASTVNIRPQLALYWYNSLTATNPFLETKSSVTSVDTINVFEQRSYSIAAPAGATHVQIGGKTQIPVTGVTGTAHYDQFVLEMSSRRIRQATLRPGTTTTWDYQTTTSDISANTWNWTARGYDGISLGAWAAQRTFVYGTGPTITITSPIADSTITNGTPTVAWLTTFTAGAAQESFRLQVWDVTRGRGYGEATVAYDYEEDGTSTFHVIPPGNLRHGREYELLLTITDTNNLTGQSVQVPFKVSYAQPKEIRNFVVFPAEAKFDTFETVNRLTWIATEESPDVFESYNIYRTGPDGDRDKIAELTSPAQVAWTDNHPRSGIEYTYEISQIIRDKNSRNNFLESVRYSGVATVNLRYAVVNSIDRTNLRIPIKFWSSRQVDYRGEERIIVPWGEKRPLVTTGTMQYAELSIDAQFINDSSGTARDYVSAMKELIALRRIVCYRDPLGRRLFGLLSLVSEDDLRGKIYSMRLRFIETAHVGNI